MADRINVVMDVDDASFPPSHGDKLEYDSTSGKWHLTAKRWAPVTTDTDADGTHELLYTDDGAVVMMEVLDE